MRELQKGVASPSQRKRSREDKKTPLRSRKAKAGEPSFCWKGEKKVGKGKWCEFAKKRAEKTGTRRAGWESKEGDNYQKE